MILYLNEDRAYLSWVAHHRGGYVLDCSRQPRAGHVVLHRSTCAKIKHAEAKKSHWTTGRHMKACSQDRAELVAWAMEQTQAEPTVCPDCLIEQPADDHPVHLTRIDRDVLSFVLEVAALHLDESDDYYALTVGAAAKCLGKTAGQLSASFHRLVADGLLKVVGKTAAAELISPNCALLPTVKALRTLPVYQSASDEEVAGDLARLVDELEL
jgi:hypothetical protein